MQRHSGALITEAVGEVVTGGRAELIGIIGGTQAQLDTANFRAPSKTPRASPRVMTLGTPPSTHTLFSGSRL